MLNTKNLRRALSNPALIARFWKRRFPAQARQHDPECRHLIDAWSSGRLPRVTLPSIFPGIGAADVLLRKCESRVVGWSLDLQELVHLLSIVRFARPQRLLEIGTYDGFTAMNIAANLEENARITTVDLPQEKGQADYRSAGISNAVVSTTIGSKFRGEPEASKIVQRFADSTTADWATFGGPFDLILIDGCHDYRFVKSDTQNALKHLNPGGRILWHDYGQFMDVSRCIDELSASHPVKVIVGTRLACLRT